MTNLSSRFRSVSLAIGLVGASMASADVSFNFDYSSDVNVGFNDPTQGAIRRSSLAAAGNYISTVLGSSYNATIDFSVNGNVQGNTTLASAGTALNSNYTAPGFGLMGDVMSKILTGVDPGGAAADGAINWNFNFGWGYGATVPGGPESSGGQYDFISTAIHELTHAIGFGSLVSQNGNSPFGEAPGAPAEFGHFDEFLADASGRIITAGGVLDNSRWQAAQISDGGLFFDGANAIAANGGQKVQLYSPNPYEGGSSVSHLNDHVFDPLVYIMDAQTGTGTGPRVYTGLEIGILKDLGYTHAAPVPEPATMVVLGLGALSMLRRRKKSA